MLLKLSPWS